MHLALITISFISCFLYNDVTAQDKVSVERDVMRDTVFLLAARRLTAGGSRLCLMTSLSLSNTHTAQKILKERNCSSDKFSHNMW